MTIADQADVEVTRKGLGPWLDDYGVFAVALFLLATSKWGSYLPFTKPPYVSDIVLGLVVLHRILFGKNRRTEVARSDGTLLRPAIAALVFWCVLEFLRGSYSLTAIRDFAPYFYAVAVFLVAVPRDRLMARVNRWIDAVIIFHAAWVTLGTAAPSVVGHLPLLAGQIYVFEPRNDFDGAVCGMFAAFALHRAFSGRSIPYNVVLAGWNVVLMLYLKERAGLIGFALALVVVIFLGKDRRSSPKHPRAKALVPLLVLCFPVLILVGSNTPAYQRTLAAIHPFVPFVHADATYAEGTGTESAREKAWGRILHWQDTSISKETLGVGFGPDFMHLSGADVLLFGGPIADARSPHNYFVGTWARIGLIGLGIVGVVVICGLWLLVVVRRTATSLTDMDVLAMIVTVAMPAAAAVGVILESPFGAVPYFWAIGHLSARASQLRTPRNGRSEAATATSEIRPSEGLPQ